MQLQSGADDDIAKGVRFAMPLVPEVRLDGFGARQSGRDALFDFWEVGDRCRRPDQGSVTSDSNFNDIKQSSRPIK